MDNLLNFQFGCIDNIEVDFEQIKKFLVEIDEDFNPRLIGRINIIHFINKIFVRSSSYICLLNGCIIGLVVLYDNDNINYSSYISFVGVLKDYRGMGIAKKLLKLSINSAKLHNMKTLGIHSNNLVAIKLYLELNFKIVDDSQDRKYLELKL